MKKEEAEKRTVKGEIEGYGRKITKFPGGRGSRGMKVEGEWHNIIGKEDFLELLDTTYEVGSFVVFAERLNKKNFWDYIEATLKSITKQEAYSNDVQDSITPGSTAIDPIPEEVAKKNDEELKSKIEEEPVRELTPADIELLKKEIQTMEAKILQKEHDNVKLLHNKKNINQALKFAISNQKNVILSAEGVILDLEYDLENEVTLKGTDNKIDENVDEIIRNQKNITVREAEIELATASNRDEKARAEVKKRNA